MNNDELVVEHPRNFSARTEVLGGTYFKIAETEYCEYLRIEQINDEELSEEEKSILDALHSTAKSSPLNKLFNTPLKDLKNGSGKKKIYKVFIDLYTSIGVWDPKTDTFTPDDQLDPNDLKIKNKIGNSTLLQSIIY